MVFEVIDRFSRVAPNDLLPANVRFMVDEATCAPVFPALLRCLAQNGRGETWMELVTPRGDVERRYAAAIHSGNPWREPGRSGDSGRPTRGGSMERTSGSCLSADRHVVLNLENAPEVVSIPTSWLRGAAPKGRGGE